MQNSSFSTTFFIFLIIHITYCNTAFYTDYVVDSTTKVGNFEQITTNFSYIYVHTVDSTTKLKILQGVCLIDRTLGMSGIAGSKTFQKAKIQA